MSNRIGEPKTAGGEPIAIVGIGCRFPGIETVESFWHVLQDGIDTICEYPGGRFDLLDRAYSGHDIVSRRGGFLPNLADFDASFFEISAREAQMLDPQQRLMLEVSWEALEDAGIPARKLAGSRTGVFAGVWTSDYEACARDIAPEDFYATTGTGRYAVSGRLAYFFDLRGPAMSVDTACSSSLVAIHMACKAVRSGECDLALAGGVNVILRPDISLAYSTSKMLSPDGNSKFGDASANGYVRSEGAGILVLKPLARAIADNDRIYALIRGSAVNNDGRSSGQLISPSRNGQEAVLRAALADAGVDPGDVDYVEAHGTGTAVGDPVEIETIGRVMGSGSRQYPCAVGSVKTNIGHTEAAAGVSGVIKTALALQKGILPASLHVKRPNPGIAWDKLPVVIQTVTGPWPQDSRPRLAGVSSFGITGTNAHVVLESVGPASKTPADEDLSRLYLLSAQAPKALRAVADSWRVRLSDGSGWPSSMTDLAFTAGTHRTAHDFRLAITARDRAELKSRLTAWLDGEPSPYIASGRRAIAAHRTVFVFPGQGGQWVGMGKSLLRAEPIFRNRLEECDLAIRRHTGWSVIDCLLTSANENSFSQVDIVQPALFAMMVGLAALWRSWGIEPDAVVGHSMGETAAAAVSGALTLDDAAAVVCHRSSLMKGANGRGRMVVTDLSFEDAIRLTEKYGGRFSVAANNSPSTTVLSGDRDAIEEVSAELEGREIFCRQINVDLASHCAHMEPFREELALRLQGIQPRFGSVPLYSTTTGNIENGLNLDADYWARNLRQPVLFSTALQKLLTGGFDTFLEVNTQPVLLHSIEESARLADKRVITAACLYRNEDERVAMLNAGGTLLVNGLPVDLEQLNPKGSCISLPLYPWQRERYWLDSQSAPVDRAPRPENTIPEVAACRDHVYDLHWIKQAASNQTPTEKACWLVVGKSGLSNRVASQIEAVGCECIRAIDEEHAQQAIESFGTLFRGVVYQPDQGGNPSEAIHETYATVRLMQAITSKAMTNPPRLWILTAGAFRLPGDSDLSSMGSPVWGLARVSATEFPELRSVNVDLSAVPPGEEIEKLVQLFREESIEEQIAVRGNECFAARYQANTAVKSGGLVAFRPDGTYLVTGGLGGIGLELARWLVVRGARHLALLGRHAPSDTARNQIAAIEALGASVRILSADVTENEQLVSTLEAIANEMPPLRGVFHLSAVAEAALLSDLTEESLRKVMLPKVAGAWNLHRNLEHTELDHFVLFSSLVAEHGQPGLGSYAAANSFLDALARYRNANGLPALSVQWCPWTNLGLTNKEGIQRGAKLYWDQGIQRVSTQSALDALGRMMLLDKAVLLVMPAAWERFARSFESNSLPRAFVELAAPAPKEEVHIEEPVRERLAKAAAGRPRRRLLETHVQETVAQVLETSPNRVDISQPLGSMGVDSLMALELVRHLSDTTGVRLPATAVFNYPSVALLSEEVARRMAISLEEETLPEAPPAAPAPLNSASPAHHISDVDAIAALMGHNINSA